MRVNAGVSLQPSLRLHTMPLQATLYLGSNLLEGLPEGWALPRTLRDLRIEKNLLLGTLPYSWVLPETLEYLSLRWAGCGLCGGGVRAVAGGRLRQGSHLACEHVHGTGRKERRGRHRSQQWERNFFSL